MQTTTPLYREIMANPAHWFEVSVIIGNSGKLINEAANYVTFGGMKILVETNSPDTGYKEAQLISISTNQSMLSDSAAVGNVIAGEIDLEMIAPKGEFPRMAMVKPYVRATDGTRHSEWLPKGVFFIDTRYTTHNSDGLDVIKIHGYDALLKAEIAYPSDDKHDYPLLDKTMVQFIADKLGVDVDKRTWANMPSGYKFNLPVEFSMREVLSMIGIVYGGNWVITDEGNLRLVTLTEIPKETRHLIDNAGYTITFGGFSIRV